MGNSFVSNDLILSTRRRQTKGQGRGMFTLAHGIAVCEISAITPRRGCGKSVHCDPVRFTLKRKSDKSWHERLFWYLSMEVVTIVRSSLMRWSPVALMHLTPGDKVRPKSERGGGGAAAERRRTSLVCRSILRIMAHNSSDTHTHTHTHTLSLPLHSNSASHHRIRLRWSTRRKSSSH